MSEALRGEVFRRVRKVVSEVLKVGEDQITPESRFVEDLKADSFDNLSLLLALESEFESSIEDEGMAGLVTVGEAVDYILRQSAEGRSASVTPS